MNGWRFLVLSAMMMGSPLAADECDDIAFEEKTCVEGECEVKHRHHYHLPEYNPEEEHMWQERSDASWAGKRDDNFIDSFLHQ